MDTEESSIFRHHVHIVQGIRYVHFTALREEGTKWSNLIYVSVKTKLLPPQLWTNWF